MLLYRALSAAELVDLQQCGQFRPGPPSFQGKWLAESEMHAIAWGRALYGTGGPFHVIEVQVPDALAALWFRLPNLDQIGPAVFVDVVQLADLNQQMLGFREVP